MKILSAALLAILILSAFGCGSKVNDPADVQAFKGMAAVRDKAFNGSDANALVTSYYTDDAVLMNQFEPATVGKEAIRAGFQKYFEKFSSESHSVIEEVCVSGDLALCRGTYEQENSLKAGGNSIQDKGKFVTAFQRQHNGSWKSIWDISSSDLPVADSLPIGEEEQALLRIENEWAEAFVKADAVMLGKILANEWAGNNDGEIVKKAQFVADLKSGVRKYEAFANGNMRPVVFGDFAVVEGSSTEKSKYRGKDSSGKSRWINFYVECDGRWQCVGSYSTKVG